jgi:hypothetical protein
MTAQQQFEQKKYFLVYFLAHPRKKKSKEETNRME